MKTDEISEIVLSCASWQEAQRLADHLFDKKLIQTAELLDSGLESQVFDAPSNGIKLLVVAAEHLYADIVSATVMLLGRDAELVAPGYTADDK
jgi:hypothetical protein